MKIGYARERLGAAVRCLVGARNIRQRLAAAYMECQPLLKEHFPANLAEKWEDIRRSLTDIRAKDEGTALVGSMLAFSDETKLERIAEAIHDLLVELWNSSEADAR